MSALKERFETMQAVLPAKVVGRGVMLISLTVLSPIGLTTLYTGSVDLSGAPFDVWAEAGALKTRSAREISSTRQSFGIDASPDGHSIAECLNLLISVGAIAIR